VELLLNSPYVSELIQRGEIDTIREAMVQSTDRGMQTFDQALFNLYEEEKITFEDALRNADSVNDIRLRIKLESEVARKTGIVEDHRDFELEESDDETASGMI
jgi:twitching motility protein PilU